MDYKVKCRVCHKKFTNMTTHLSKIHGLNKKDYQLKYPGAEVVSAEFRDY